jgi:hypothetical protein
MIHYKFSDRLLGAKNLKRFCADLAIFYVVFQPICHIGLEKIGFISCVHNNKLRVKLTRKRVKMTRLRVKITRMRVVF